MISSKAVKLVADLYAGTQARRLEWKATGIDDVYQLTLPEHAIQIAERGSSQSPQGCIEVSMYDREARLIDRFTDEDFEGREQKSWAWRTMSDLYRLARGYALGVEQAYDAVLREVAEPDTTF
jgi:hypothetical protein